MHSRYHPDYSPEGNLSRTSGKVLLCNGSPRIPLLAEAFTGPTQEPDRPIHLRRLTPAAGSLEQKSEGTGFPSKSFRSICDIKSYFSPCVNWKNEQFSGKIRILFWGEKHLTFWHGHGIVSSISEKGFDEDGQTEKSPESRRLVRVGGFKSKDPSLPSRRTERLSQ